MQKAPILKTSLAVLSSGLCLAANPALAQSWETIALAKEGGIGAVSVNADSAELLVSCSEDGIPAVTIGLPVMDLPDEVAPLLTIFVDGEKLRDSLGFETTPAGTGIWLNGDANAQWHNVRWLSEKIVEGERLTVMAPSLGFATNFDLTGAREAMAEVVEACGLRS